MNEQEKPAEKAPGEDAALATPGKEPRPKAETGDEVARAVAGDAKDEETDRTGRYR